jgi:hypothetical protein
LISRAFQAIWNQADFVPGEFYIEFLPKAAFSEVKEEVYLAFLSSSLFEFLVRTKAHLYGGGAYNLSPGQIKDIPCLNFALLSEKHKNQLEIAYIEFLRNKDSRSKLDKLIFDILGFDKDFRSQIKEALSDLTELVTSSQKDHDTN